MLFFRITALSRQNSHTMQFTPSKCTVHGFSFIHQVPQLSPLPNLRTFSSLPERNLTVISSHSTSVASQTPSPLIDFQSQWICSFWTVHINGILYHVAFQLASFTVRLLNCTVSILPFFLELKNMPLHGHTTVCLFIHQLMDIRLFMILVSMLLCIFPYAFQVDVCFHFRQIPRRGEFWGHTVTVCLMF